MPTRERRAKQLGIPIDQLPDDARGKHNNHSRGPKHWRWKGGKSRLEVQHILDKLERERESLVLT